MWLLIVLKGALCVLCLVKSENFIPPHDCLTTVIQLTVYSLQCEPFLLGRITFGLCLSHGIICSWLLTWTGLFIRISGLLWHWRVVFCERVDSSFYCHHRTMWGREWRGALTTLTTLVTGRRLSAQYSGWRYVVKTWSLWYCGSVVSHSFSHTLFNKRASWFFPFW